MKIILIILVLIIISCSPKQKKIVYFEPPKDKIVAENNHVHSPINKPHFEPIREHKISHDLTNKYDLLYNSKHKKIKKHDDFIFLLINILIVNILTAIYL